MSEDISYIKIQKIPRYGKPLSLRNGSAVKANEYMDAVIEKGQKMTGQNISIEKRLNFIRLTCFRIIKSEKATQNQKSFAQRELKIAESAFINGYPGTIVRIYYIMKKFTLSYNARDIK